MTFADMMAATEAACDDPVQLMVCADFLEESSTGRFLRVQNTAFALRWMAERKKRPLRVVQNNETEWVWGKEGRGHKERLLISSHPYACIPWMIFYAIGRGTGVDIRFTSFINAVEGLGSGLAKLRAEFCLKREL